MSYRILLGDVLERLRELPDESVHCVVTSPPYWGLRDYGTGAWSEGRFPCDHVRTVVRTGAGMEELGKQYSGGGKKAAFLKEIKYSDECPMCGAVRVDHQIGLEKTPEEYISKMVEVFREVRRVLRSDGTCWVNMGDSYANFGTGGNGATGGRDKSTLTTQMPPVGTTPTKKNMPEGMKPKDLCGMPWMLAFALRSDGWWLRQDIIWAKPNPMPESVTDRCTKAHEYLFLLSKSAKYYFDQDAIRTPYSEETKALSFETMEFSRRDEYKNPSHHGSSFTKGKTAATKPTVGQGERADNPLGANKRSVWNIATEAFPEAHFATFPTKLVEPCILAGTSEKGCCSKCGAPWERVMEDYDTGKTQKMADGWDTGEGGHGTVHREGRQAGQAGQAVIGRRTLAWSFTCKCDAEVVPCTVMDIFNGSGTTGVVALRYGRNYIGIELNPEYAAMADRRIGGDSPLFNIKEEDTVAV